MTDHVPPRIHVLAKPAGAICNLACSYCFFLDKERLYPGSPFSRTDQVLESYIRQLIAAHRTPQVTVAWQGGEPTLMEVMEILAGQEADLQAQVAQAGRNAPCGSGRKVKHCHGRGQAVRGHQTSRLPAYRARPRARAGAVSE